MNSEKIISEIDQIEFEKADSFSPNYQINSSSKMFDGFLMRKPDS